MSTINYHKLSGSVHMWVCTCVWRSEVTLGLAAQVQSTLFCEAGFLRGLELTKKAGLANGQAPGNFVSVGWQSPTTMPISFCCCCCFNGFSKLNSCLHTCMAGTLNQYFFPKPTHGFVNRHSFFPCRVWTPKTEVLAWSIPVSYSATVWFCVHIISCVWVCRKEEVLWYPFF